MSEFLRSIGYRRASQVCSRRSKRLDYNRCPRIESFEEKSMPAAVVWDVEDGGNGHAYEVVSARATWDQASDAARAKQGHLATIDSPAENEFVYSLTLGYWRALVSPDYWWNYGPWIGASRPFGPGSGGWSWVTGEAFDWTSWAPGEPNNEFNQENKAHFFTSQSQSGSVNVTTLPTWNDLNPDGARRGAVGLPYVVEYEPPKLKNVSFTGEKNLRVDPDPGSGRDYSRPQFKSDRDNYQAPVWYTIGGQMAVSAEFEVLPTSRAATYLVRGDGPGGYDFPEMQVAATGTTLRIENAIAATRFDAQVRYFAAFNIRWETSFDNGITWLDSGTSINQVYVSADNFLFSAYHTVLHAAVSYADGLSAFDKVALTDAAWKPFAGAKFVSAYGKPLTYWGAREQTRESYYTKDLLGYGDGRCGAWADLFGDVLLVQGISFDQITVLPPLGYSSLLVNEWDFGAPTSNPDLPYFEYSVFVGDAYLEKANFSEARGDRGIDGQNNLDPTASFTNHALVRIGTIYFDPSYGRRYDNLAAWEAASVAGFSIGHPVIAKEWEEKQDFNDDGDLFDLFPGFFTQARQNRPGREVREEVQHVAGFTTNAARIDKMQEGNRFSAQLTRALLPVDNESERSTDYVFSAFLPKRHRPLVGDTPMSIRCNSVATPSSYTTRGVVPPTKTVHRPVSEMGFAIDSFFDRIALYY